MVWLTLFSALASASDLERLAGLDATPGEEQAAVEYVRSRLGGQAKDGGVDTVFVSFGQGEPHTLLVAGLDEPGYAVSEITAEGYLRLHRLAEPPPSYQFDSYWPGWPVKVFRRGRAALPGVMAAPSVHFSSDRGFAGGSRSLDSLYVDIGATSAADVDAAGVALLDRVTFAAGPARLGEGEVTAPWISSHAGAALLLRLAELLREHPPMKGRVTLAFASQQHYHNAGLLRMLRLHKADRLAIVRPGGDNGLAVSGAAGWSSDLTDEIREWGRANGVRVDAGGAPRISFGPFAPEDAWKNAGKSAILTLGPRNAGTPAESFVWKDLDEAGRLLAWIAGLPPGVGFALSREAIPAPPEPKRPADAFVALLEDLVGLPGVSGSETAVRDAIRTRLPPAHAKAAEIDDKGNLIVRVGAAGPPRAIFLAHMDEIGFRVTNADESGAAVEAKGGLSDELFGYRPLTLWQGVRAFPAVMGRFGQLRAGATAAAGDTATPAKRLERLLNERVSGRSLDDRAGCAVLLTALARIKASRSANAVWFVFTVEEEIGLFGAEAIALRTSPRRVYAVDSLVTSDSPLEPTRLGNLKLGEGAAVRAMDNSGLSARAEVERVLALARSKGIPARAGVTAGGNDGSKFAQAGAANVPLAFPLRYSHSAAETADLRDLRALTDLVTALAEEELR